MVERINLYGKTFLFFGYGFLILSAFEYKKNNCIQNSGVDNNSLPDQQYPMDDKSSCIEIFAGLSFTVNPDFSMVDDR